MKDGLYLNESPEPIYAIKCYNCSFVASTSWEWRLHYRVVHNNYKKRHFNLPIRPIRRILFTAQEMINRNKKLCHCGKPPTPPRRKYCSEKCTNDWYDKTLFSSQHRDNFIHKHNGACENCGNKKIGGYLEMDHIIALVFGGHPWDKRNLQGLCYDCHKIKSASDMKILAWWKRVDKFYDIGLYK